MNTTTSTDRLNKLHNMPAHKEIATALHDGIQAARKGDFAQARLCVGVYHAFSEACDDSGTSYLVNLHAATEYMKGAGKGADEKAIAAAKDKATDFIDLYCSLFSDDYNVSIKWIAELDGRKLKDSELELKLEHTKTLKRIRVMVGRAIGVAAFIRNQDEVPTHVNFIAKTGEIRQVWEHDALNASFDSLEKAMRTEYPKVRGPKERDDAEEEETVVDAGTTLLGSIAFITTHVTVQNYAAQSKDVREQMEAMFKQLLPIFASKMTPEPVAAPKPKLGVKTA